MGTYSPQEIVQKILNFLGLPDTRKFLISYKYSLLFWVGIFFTIHSDSGCSDHITHKISDFSEYRRLNTPQYVRLADGSMRVAFIGVGMVSATTQIQGVTKYITLENVIHSPDLGGRFISIRKVGEKGISTTFLGNTATLHKEGIDYGGYSESSDICTCRLFCLYFIVHVDICCMCDSL